jgi:hypothetical protein
VTPADLSALSGLSIGAAPLVDLALLRALRELGVDGADVRPVPGAFLGGDRNFRVAAAKALRAGLNLTTAPVGFTDVVASAFAPHWG